jgi:hypothetical protein
MKRVVSHRIKVGVVEVVEFTFIIIDKIKAFVLEIIYI